MKDTLREAVEWPLKYGFSLLTIVCAHMCAQTLAEIIIFTKTFFFKHNLKA